MQWKSCNPIKKWQSHFCSDKSRFWSGPDLNDNKPLIPTEVKWLTLNQRVQPLLGATAALDIFIKSFLLEILPCRCDSRTALCSVFFIISSGEIDWRMDRYVHAKFYKSRHCRHVLGVHALIMCLYLLVSIKQTIHLRGVEVSLVLLS